jgi:hypothetical protein
MANFSVSRSKHSTLGAATVDTVTLTKEYSFVEVVNRDATAANVIYFTADGSTPTVAGDNTIVVAPGQRVSVAPEGLVIKVIGAAASPYSVHGVR